MNYKIIGLTRVRNEALILKDTLDHFGKFVDGIVVYDDCSSDASPQIAKNHPNVIEVILNNRWKKNRAREETRQRQLLLEAGRRYDPEWFFYVDADERFEGRIHSFLLSKEALKVSGIRIQLIDAYLTAEDKKAYTRGKLWGLRKKFGPERREILMLFRNKPEAAFVGMDAREPVIYGTVITKFWCQHYGKALSIAHWKETCDFYVKYFPKYSKKWRARYGKAVHALSDFERPLYSWKEIKKQAITIYSYECCPRNFLEKVRRGIRKFYQSRICIDPESLAFVLGVYFFHK